MSVQCPPPSTLLSTSSPPEGHRRGHRLSLQPGHKMTNYLKFLQELAIRQVASPPLHPAQASGGAMASQLFSTAVISGSSSSPNLGAGGGDCPESKWETLIRGLTGESKAVWWCGAVQRVRSLVPTHHTPATPPHSPAATTPPPPPPDAPPSR